MGQTATGKISISWLNDLSLDSRSHYHTVVPSPINSMQDLDPRAEAASLKLHGMKKYYIDIRHTPKLTPHRYRNLDRPLDEAALPKPILGIDPVLAAVGFRGDRVEGITPSPDYHEHDSMTPETTHIHD
jgi:hypothetical protein